MSTTTAVMTKMNEDLLSKERLTLCAVSGGIDSMYLLCRLSELGYLVTAAHFNHRLRGEESDRDEAFVRNFCHEKEIPFCAGSGDVTAEARRRGIGTEEAARILRYEFLEKTADEVGAYRIATAHTADDNAETILLNLARGAGLRGLCGIPPVRGRIVRPMLDVTRAEAERYLAERGIAHVEDSTNASDDYARNRIRHGAVPVLRQVNPGFARNAARTAELLRQDEEVLCSLASEFLREHTSDQGVDASALCALPEPISSRVIRCLAGAELSRAHVQEVLKTARDGGAADIPGMRVERRGKVLLFGASKPAELPERTIIPGEPLDLPEAGLTLFCERLAQCPDVYRKLNIFFFKCGNICGNMTVAARRDGEKVRLAGRGCTKPLRRLLMEAGIPASERCTVPVLRDDVGVIGIYGIGAAERICAKPGDRDILKIEIVRREPGGE